MIWVIVSILSIGSASMAEGSHVSGASLSDVVRRGATIASTFLNSKIPNSHSFAFPKLNEQVIGGSGERRRNEGILALLRLLGVDSQKIQGFAFDAFISLLHLMSQVFLKHGDNDRKGRRAPRTFPSFRFILGQPQVVGLLKDMQNPRLVDLILKESEEKLRDFPKENVECIRLLVCKTKPFVRGMQRSLRFFMRRENVPAWSCAREAAAAAEGDCAEGEEDARWEAEDLEGRMFFFVPALREVLNEGDKCDLLFPNCLY